MPVLPKGGLQVAGHKIPWEAIAAIAGVAGVLLVLRARSQGQGVSVGAAPAGFPTAADSGFGSAGSFTPDISGALANISQELAGLSTSGVNAPAPAPSSPGGIFGFIRQGGGVPSFDPTHTGVPIDLAPGQFGGMTVPFGDPVSILGTVQGPLNLPGGSNWWDLVFDPKTGQTGYVSAWDLNQFAGGMPGGGGGGPIPRPLASFARV
jgi:hypothetical protein